MKGKTWTEQEDQKVIDLFPYIPASEIGDRINRSKSAVQHRALTLGLTGNAALMPAPEKVEQPRREYHWKDYAPKPIAPWFRERMETVAAIPSYKPKAMQL